MLSVMTVHPSGSRIVKCGRIDANKLIVAFRNVAKAPENKALLLDNLVCGMGS